VSGGSSGDGVSKASASWHDTQTGLPIELGAPGSSGRSEYQRRRARDDNRRRERWGGVLAPVAKAIGGERQSTSAWARGATGEERVGRYLTKALAGVGLVLHDRRLPGSQANIDHIAVVPSGVWVIDTKHYRGLVEPRDVGGWFRTDLRIYVRGRDRTKLAHAVSKQAERVRAVVGQVMPIHPVLCFEDADWGVFGRGFTHDGVLVTWAKKLTGRLREPGPLTNGAIQDVARQLASHFPLA
jgi:nuclease-like protein